MNIIDNLITKSFNFGLYAAAERQFITVNAASNYFFDFIYNELDRNFKDSIDDISIRSLTNYLVSISLISYTLHSTGIYNDISGAKFLKKIIKSKPKEIKEIENNIYHSHKYSEVRLEIA